MTKIPFPRKYGNDNNIVLASGYGIASNHNMFLTLVERYNARTWAFSTPQGEMGFVLHEMHVVSDLPMGEVPYEEYVPTNQELQNLAKKEPRPV